MDRPHILKPIEFYMKACFAMTVIFPGGEDQVNVLTVVRRPSFPPSGVLKWLWLRGLRRLEFSLQTGFKNMDCPLAHGTSKSSAELCFQSDHHNCPVYFSCVNSTRVWCMGALLFAAAGQSNLCIVFHCTQIKATRSKTQIIILVRWIKFNDHLSNTLGAE